jgi:hypothetical protein
MFHLAKHRVLELEFCCIVYFVYRLSSTIILYLLAEEFFQVEFFYLAMMHAALAW